MTTSRIKNVLVCVLSLAAFAGFADTDINITTDTTLYASDINADANYKVKAGVTLTIDIDSNVSCRCLRNDSEENPGGKVVKKGPGTLTLTKKSSNNEYNTPYGCAPPIWKNTIWGKQKKTATTTPMA